MGGEGRAGEGRGVVRREGRGGGWAVVGMVRVERLVLGVVYIESRFALVLSSR